MEDIVGTSRNAALELCDKAWLKPGQTVVVGCSTSEVTGQAIGSSSNPDIGLAIFKALHGVFAERGVFIAAQCCEHLNRALVLEREAATGYSEVNAVPAPDAGGSFATAAYGCLSDPVLIEMIQADAGLDIGGTLIGMHLKRVAIPLRLANSRIGMAAIAAARTRPPLIGGSRAHYDARLS